jgi:hypothetical protein
MNKAKAGCFPFIFLLFLFSCASTQEIKRQPDFKVAGITLSRAVEDGTSAAAPKDPATIFSPKDPEVLAFLKIKNLWGAHILKWNWIDPEGRLYYSTGDYTIQCAEGKYLKEVTTWHKLSIRGDKAERLLGNWTLNIYLDKDLVAVRNFRIDGNVEPSEIPHNPK